MSGDYVVLDVGLPLPLDVSSTLLNVIGTAYPGAMIDTTVPADNLGREVMRLRIPNADRYADAPSRERIGAARKVVESENEGILASVREGIAVATPDAVKHQVGLLASRLFADNPAAVNYVQMEMQVGDPDTRERFVLTVQRADAKSPHQLRVEAEARVAELENEIRRLRGHR